MRPAISLVIVALAGLAAPAARSETYVTTYVVKVQEQRESTRWTLTEWLHIKDRMKMMDLWLAMFSDPKKDKFQPELMLSYGMTRGSFKYVVDGGQTDNGSLSGTNGRAQLWLTNIISSTIGWRTLNVDLGIEGGKRTAGSYASSSPAPAAAASANALPAAGAAAAATPSTTLTAQRNLDATYYTGDLRLFGKNIQDSSLVLKYGQYTAHNTILDAVGTPDTAATTGALAGAELQLYFLRFLGVEGNYLRYGDGSGPRGTYLQNGNYYDYMGFVEISLLRLMGGAYAETWSIERQGQMIKTQEKGTIGAVKLQF